MTRRIFCKILLVVVAVFALLALPGVVQAQGRSDEALERAKEAQEKHTDELMARPGVVGTAVGLDQDAQPVVLVLLEHGNVPGIPDELERIPVKKMVTGEIRALSFDTTARWRPAPIGVSTGHPLITAGTIGCRVTDGTYVYALSNNHVYANQNDAFIGDNVLQPGPYDGGMDTDDYRIGTLADFEPIVFSRKASNVIDAAIAAAILDSGTPRVGNATPDGGYGTPNSTTVDASLGLPVQKFGRTTLLTKGDVTGLNATVLVSYGPGKTARFVKQIVIGPGGFSDGGDSGSLIVTDDTELNPVGLLFAGSSSVTIANPIDAVLTRFGVSVDGQTATPLPPPPVAGTLTVGVTTDKSIYALGDTAYITVTVDDGEGVAVSNAAAHVEITTASGRLYVGDGTTNSNGVAVFKFKIKKPDGTGTYTVDASASKSGYSPGSDSITFGVP
ncbi:MAG: MG2 domain-containing protein [Planctomycetota bacterium]